MIGFLVSLIVIVAIIYVVNLVLAQLSLPQPIKQIVYLIIGLVVLFWLLDAAGLYHFSSLR